MQADLGLHCLPTELVDTEVYVDKQRTSRADHECTRSSGPSLFAYGVRAFFHRLHIILSRAMLSVHSLNITSSTSKNYMFQ